MAIRGIHAGAAFLVPYALEHTPFANVAAFAFDATVERTVVVAVGAVVVVADDDECLTQPVMVVESPQMIAVSTATAVCLNGATF